MNSYGSTTTSNTKKNEVSIIPKIIEDISKQWESLQQHFICVQTDISHLERMYMNYGKNQYYLNLREELIRYQNEILQRIYLTEQNLNHVRTVLQSQSVNY